LEAISTIAQRFDNLEETDIKEFSNTLDSLQNTLISVCNKAVLIEVPEGQESILQKTATTFGERCQSHYKYSDRIIK
jgi:hypothetical protein